MKRPCPTLFLATFFSFACSSISSAEWAEDGISVCTMNNAQVFSAVVPDNAGGVIAAWWDERTSSLPRVFAQKMSSTGVPQWTPNGIPIFSTLGSETGPPGMISISFGAIIVWTDHRSASLDVYAQKIDGAGVTEWAPDGLALITTAGFEQFASIISDATAGAFNPIGYYIATFENNSGFADVLRLQRVYSDGTGLWTTASAGGTVVASAIPMGSVSMASDGVGQTVIIPRGAMLAWTDFRAGAAGDIYARRVTPDGVAQWASNGVPVCTEASSQADPVIANVSSGKDIIVWSDSRNSATTGTDIYAQMLDSSGNALWTGNGIFVCNASGTQRKPKILRDNAGGAFVIWLDSRQIPAPVLYAQRIDSNGQRLWDPDGVRLSTLGTVEQIDTDQHMLPSETGFIASWSDLRSPPSDVFVQRLDGDGNVQWGSEARALCTAPGASWDPMLAGDSSSGVIATWMDGRNGNLDIFANRIPFSGGGVDVPVMESTGLQFSLVSSNPVRGSAQLMLHLPEASRVALDVFDVTGRHVRAIPGGGWLEAGAHPFIWEGTDELGAPVPAGMYFVRASALQRSTTHRLVLLR